EPVEDVMIRSEVSGYITAVHFEEGGMVKEGDLLFTIDRNSYQATADAAEAELNRAQKLYDRMKNSDARSISRSDLETAESNLQRAQAALKLAQVSLNYTEIKAPVSGRIGAAQVTKGNYVTSASGSLARIVQIDPVRVTFSMTDREYLKFRQQELSGSAATRVAQARLPDGTVLSAVGKKDFDDNAINPATGTMAVRYLFDNRDGLLIPGGYVTALLRHPEAEKGIKIPQKAQLVDQQGVYVLTVDEKGLVSPVRIVTGTQIGTEVTVLLGLKEGDRIIVDGVQKTRPGATVNVIQAEVK
ncbi:MAG: efflux RND transporter periplasmic adaptor subunit, partial [Verrucomicrobia bacterium]|nr:efflux RND transporter periplasmic adaptor subunit [Verrucomicrobiota bacterium]